MKMVTAIIRHFRLDNVSKVPKEICVWGLPPMIARIAACSPCRATLNYRKKLGYDDSLDAFGVHGVGGIIGTIGAGLFASSSINGINGLFSGNPRQLVNPQIGIGAVAVYSFVCCPLILKVVYTLISIR